MTFIRQCFFPAFCIVSLTCGSFLSAEDDIDSLVSQLADNRYAVRVEAKKKLIDLSRQKPQLLDRLAPIALDEEDEIERVLNVRDIIAEAIFIERGAIGFALSRKLIVERLVDKGPAMESGIQIGAKLHSVSGKSVEGKAPAEIYSLIHSARPGTKLEMEFADQDGQKILLYPKVAPRSTIRSDENAQQRRQDLYGEWMERKREELQPGAD